MPQQMDPFKRATLLLCQQYTSMTTSAEVAEELPALITEMAADPDTQPQEARELPTPSPY